MRKSSHGIVFLLIMVIFSNPLHAQECLEGQAAPDWTLSNLAGQKVRFPDDYLGKPTVVLFWATWCPYCSALMPYLNEIRNEQEVKILALNFKEDGDPGAHMRRLGFDFEVFLDADEVAERYGTRYSPGLFVINGHGTVIYQRQSTDKKPGKEIAEFWADQVKKALISGG